MKSNTTSQEFKKQKIASGSSLNPSTGPIPREKGTIFSQIPKFIGEKKTSMQVTPVVPISVLLSSRTQQVQKPRSQSNPRSEFRKLAEKVANREKNEDLTIEQVIASSDKPI